MQSQYQSLLGAYEPLDILELNSLLVHKDILVEGGIESLGNTILHNLTLPNGAAEGLVLTSDANGLASWGVNDPPLVGDASGKTSETRVDTLAGGTIPVDTLVTMDGNQNITNKWLNVHSVYTSILAATDRFTVESSGVLGKFLKASSDNGVAEWSDVTGESQATPDTLVQRDATGSAAFSKLAATDIQLTTGANYGRVLTSDAMGNGIWKDITGEVGPTPNTLVQRDSTGGSGFKNLATENLWVSSGAATGKVLKSDSNGKATWGDVTGTSASTPGTLVQRDSLGNTAFNKTMTNTLLVSTGASSGKVLTSDASGNATWQTPAVSTGVSIATPNTLVQRDATASAVMNVLGATRVNTIGTGYDKVVIFDGTQNVANSMQVCGLGLSDYTLRYQTDKPATDHVFYTATSHTTANELMRIGGNGTVRFNGVTTMGTRIQPKLLSIFDGAPNDSTRHDYLGFGVSNGMLRYHVGVPSDDHVFFAATGQKTSNELMRVKGNGAVVIPGSLSVGSMVSGANSFYEEYRHLTGFTGAYPTAPGIKYIFRLVRVGKMVTMTAVDPFWNQIKAVSNGTLDASDYIPVQFRPSTEVAMPCHITMLTNVDHGIVYVSAAGRIVITPQAGHSWVAGQYIGYRSFSISWCI